MILTWIVRVSKQTGGARYSTRGVGPSGERRQVEGLMEPFKGRDGKIVRETVQDYCERHFARLARESLHLSLKS